jgi:hypothetical protein
LLAGCKALDGGEPAVLGWLDVAGELGGPQSEQRLVIDRL